MNILVPVSLNISLRSCSAGGFNIVLIDNNTLQKQPVRKFLGLAVSVSGWFIPALSCYSTMQTSTNGTVPGLSLCVGSMD